MECVLLGFFFDQAELFAKVADSFSPIVGGTIVRKGPWEGLICPAFSDPSVEVDKA